MVDGVLCPASPYPEGSLSVSCDGQNYTVELPDPPQEEEPAE